MRRGCTTACGRRSTGSSRTWRAPRTVLHGDVHVGNTYFVPGQRGGVLDWQLMLHGSWVVDVGYLLTSALEPDVRARHERDLLAEYLARSGPTAPMPRATTMHGRSTVGSRGVVMWVVTPEVCTPTRCSRRACGVIAAADELEALDLLDE